MYGSNSGLGQCAPDDISCVDIGGGGIGPGTLNCPGDPGCPGYVAFPGATTSAPAGGGFWSALTASLGAASNILSKRYAVPQLNPGQLIQTGPGGTSLMYQGTAGSMSLPFGASLGVGAGLGGMLPLLLIGGVVLFVMSRK